VVPLDAELPTVDTKSSASCLIYEGPERFVMKLAILPVCGLAALSLAAPAQAQDWDFSASLYLYMAETETNIGNQSSTLSFSDALDNLDGSFMGLIEGNNGQWGFILDYMMTDISFDNSTPGPVFGGTETSVKTSIFSGFVTYRLYSTSVVQTDLLGGFRWYDTKTRIKLLPGTSPGQSRSRSDDWTDPIIGVRSRFAIGGKWSGTALADIGGWSDRSTWQIAVTADYSFNDNWVGSIGYRIIDVTNDEGPLDYGFRQSGPLLGLTYRF